LVKGEGGETKTLEEVLILRRDFSFDTRNRYW
jgi:hypothetical protein